MKNYNDHYIMVRVKLHKEKDKDLIEKVLRHDNKQAYIKELIRKEERYNA